MRMGDTKNRWDVVGRSFAELGRRLGDRYDAMRSEEQDQVSDAVDRIVTNLDRAFTSLGDTIRDPESKHALERAGRSLADAVAGTFEDVGERVRRRLGTDR
jgi:hypothetical protein